MSSCEAYLEQRVSELPTPKPRKNIPTKQTNMLVLRKQDQILFELRPSSGIWGGLLSLPEMPLEENVEQYIQNRFGLSAVSSHKLSHFQHVFTHFKLEIQPIVLKISNIQPLNNAMQYRWLSVEEGINGAIPAPIRQILLKLSPELSY